MQANRRISTNIPPAPNPKKPILKLRSAKRQSAVGGHVAAEEDADKLDDGITSVVGLGRVTEDANIHGEQVVAIM